MQDMQIMLNIPRNTLRPVSNVVLLPRQTQWIWRGRGATFEIIQFSNLNLVRHGKARSKRHAITVPNSIHKLWKCICLSGSALTLLRLTVTFSLFWIFASDLNSTFETISVLLPRNLQIKFIWIGHGNSATFIFSSEIKLGLVYYWSGVSLYVSPHSRSSLK